MQFFILCMFILKKKLIFNILCILKLKGETKNDKPFLDVIKTRNKKYVVYFKLIYLKTGMFLLLFLVDVL